MDLTRRTYLLITGASRGIGQTMAIELAKKVSANSVLVLLARSLTGLANTKADISETAGSSIKVLTYSIDLTKATAEEFTEILSSSLDGSNAGEFERAFIIHNAGTVGNVSKYAREITDTDELKQYYHMNLFSAITLNSEFMRTFANVPKMVVNLSTLAAMEPFVSFAYYCSVKAARDMYFRVLALEEDGRSTVKNTTVLSYAPGAIDTDMTAMVQAESHNEMLTTQFKYQRDTKTMLTPLQTTQRFIAILEAQEYKSGDHVDYWDKTTI